MADDPAASTWGEMLSASPLVVQAFTSLGFPLGAASAIGPSLANRKVHFLVTPSWSVEISGASDKLAQTARSYVGDHPHHRVTVLANTPRETELIVAAGQAAVTINHNILMNDAVFRPLPRVEPVYDAIYNARLCPEKRPELAAAIARLAFVYFHSPSDGSVKQFHDRYAAYKALMPQAHFLNPLTPDGCQWFMPEQLTVILAHSRVGLCLSPVEGAMRASIEYLFAGLPVVSIPSLGGRDRYFDDEYCVIARPDPRSVREAVDALVRRNVPRDYIRAKTLARVDADRRRYIALVQDLIDRGGGSEDFARRFWACTRSHTIMRWRPMPEFAATIRHALEQDRSGAPG